ncbi:putative purine permease 3 [Capsicum annuum]|nr:putative purine permease 3 [Capsicum annuum]
MESQNAITSPTVKKFLILINSILLFTSNCAGPLTMRLYFVRGGLRIWLSSCLSTAGFPFTIFLLIIAYSHRIQSDGPDNTKILLMTRFIMVLLAALFYGFVLAFNEVSFRKTRKAIAFTLVLEFQLMMCFFATAFCVVGMLINKDFQAITREAKQFELGEGKYYMVIVLTALIWQIYFLGSIGVTCYSSALLSGILIAASLSVTEVFAVIFFHEKFGGEKGFSLSLSLGICFLLLW